MDKIPTLFLRNPENMKLVTQEVNPEAAWVFAVAAVPTVKRDGTNVRVTIHQGRGIRLEKRRNPTREEKVAGAEPGYIDASRDDPSDKHLFAAFDNTEFQDWPDGAWPAEALGPKIQGGIESDIPHLYAFSWDAQWIEEEVPLTYDGIKAFLETHDYEGIVWHEQSAAGRMAKIKRRDFGLKWPVKKEEA